MQTNARFRISWASAGLAAAAGFYFRLLRVQPLWHTDLWGHLAYGRYIWKTGELPETEPLMPLAEGVRFVDTAWLSQLIGFAAHSAHGIPALQFLYAASITACVVLLMGRCYQRTGNAWLTLAGSVVFVAVDWQQLLIVRPQLAGLVCFVLLFVILTSRKWYRANWVVVPVLFAIWVNLHGSFPVGLALLGAFCVGRGFDLLRRTRQVASLVHDRRVRRFLLLTGLAALAVFLNPYGPEIYKTVFSISNSPNLVDLVEWRPLTLQMKQGQMAAGVVLVLLIVYRFSPRRISMTELLPLVGLGAGTLWSSRMIVWWAPVIAYSLTLHGGSVWKRFRGKAAATNQSPHNRLWIFVTIGLIWICSAYAPLGFARRHEAGPKKSSGLSWDTPLKLAEYLNESPPRGQIFNSMEWGDYLLWAGPGELKIFVGSHVHLTPPEVWRDYMRVIRMSNGWEKVFDRYAVDTVILDHRRRSLLISRLWQSGTWRLEYEDDRAAMFARRIPFSSREITD